MTAQVSSTLPSSMKMISKSSDIFKTFFFDPIHQAKILQFARMLYRILFPFSNRACTDSYLLPICRYRWIRSFIANVEALPLLRQLWWHWLYPRRLASIGCRKIAGPSPEPSWRSNCIWPRIRSNSRVFQFILLNYVHRFIIYVMLALSVPFWRHPLDSCGLQ